MNAWALVRFTVGAVLVAKGIAQDEFTCLRGWAAQKRRDHRDLTRELDRYIGCESNAEIDRRKTKT